MGRLVLADRPHQLGRHAVAGDEIGVDEEVLRPGEHVGRRDLDQEQVDHPLDQRLDLERDVREPALGDLARPDGLGRRRRCARRRRDAEAEEEQLGEILDGGSSNAMSRARNHMSR